VRGQDCRRRRHRRRRCTFAVLTEVVAALVAGRRVRRRRYGLPSPLSVVPVELYASHAPRKPSSSSSSSSPSVIHTIRSRVRSSDTSNLLFHCYSCPLACLSLENRDVLRRRRFISRCRPISRTRREGREDDSALAGTITLRSESLFPF